MDISSLYDKAECVDTKEYSLSIRLMPGGFSFSIHNKLVDNSFVYFDRKGNDALYSLMDFENSIIAEDILCDEYNGINLIVASDRFTLVPAELFDENEFLKFYEFNIESRDEEVVYKYMPGNDCYIIFGIDTDKYLFLKRTFSDLNIYHHLEILGEYFVSKSRMGNSEKMYCQVRYGMLDIICYKKGKLCFMNSFRYKHIDDVTYFVMNIWKTLGYDQYKDSLQIISDGEITSSLINTLKEYISLVTPVVFPSEAFNLGKQCLNAPFDIIPIYK